MKEKLQNFAILLPLLALVGCKSVQHVSEASSACSVDSYAVHFIDSFARHTFLDSVSLTIFDTLHTVQFVRVSRAHSETQATQRDTTTVAHRDTTYVFQQSAPAHAPRLSLRAILTYIVIFFIGFILHEVISRVWH